MSWETTSKSLKLDDGREIIIETGKLARQADGAVTVQLGKTVLLATVVSSREGAENNSFFPLSVDYQEKFAAAGRIPGGFLKRESKLSNYEVLISRLVDRAIRPLFPDGYMYSTQVNIMLLSNDETVMPDTLAGLAASAALSISDIPFNGPISEVRVARIDGEFIVNPKVEDFSRADIDIILAADSDNILMVEGEAKECSEEDFVTALKVGHEVIRQHCQLQRDLAAAIGKTKREYIPEAENPEVRQLVSNFAKERISKIAKSASEKNERAQAFKQIENELIASLGEEADETLVKKAAEYYHDLHKKVVRNLILDEQIRLDGRKLHEIRPLLIETDILPVPHGSSLFCRGETQALTTCTLGSKQDELMLDKAIGLSYEKFVLHYNFPGFSTGEVKPNRAPGRREIGHGNLAMRSLAQVLPNMNDYAYTIRVVSDVLESNGSSSMATTCAGSLALMDAGVPIKTNVSGIAMGLIAEGDRYAVLSDILGDEDHLGDMDFKVTGTANGICGVQMDLKIEGLPYEVMIAALEQAREGRLHILNEMNKIQAEPRVEPKPHAPRIEVVYVPGEFIGAIIGPGGKIIQEMQRQTKTTITIEETEDRRGRVTIFSANRDGLLAALNIIKGITAIPEVGEIYEGKVRSIMPYGAFVEFMPGKEGLLHISEVSWKRLDSLEGILNEGDVIQVKLLEVDQKTGKFRLSQRVLQEKPADYKERPADSGGNNRGGYQGGGNRNQGGGNRGNYDRPRR